MTAETKQKKSFTPGPWSWQGDLSDVRLATTHSGQKVVMDFRRKGFHGAQPRFQPSHFMVPASELLKFEVGDQTIVGEKAAKEDDSVYRMDVRGIDCADARLIAAAPCLYEACVKSVVELAIHKPDSPVIHLLKDVIAKVDKE